MSDQMDAIEVIQSAINGAGEVAEIVSFPTGGRGGGAGPEPKITPNSEDSIALAFSRAHGSDLRYVAAWGQWLCWTGSRWATDEVLHSTDLMRHQCRQAASEAETASQARTLASYKTMAGAERLARSDKQHAATVDQWDQAPLLLNTPGGVYDLTTGQARPARRDDYMTKCTAITPGGECPAWMSFLGEVTGGDKEVEAFLQRVAGYCLTGVTDEHALFFVYGTGSNGKSVFLNTLGSVMGDYSMVAPMEMFIATTGERHSTELAALRGARLVTASETSEGRRWAEAKLKMLTGGDSITARFMRRDFFSYRPQFKVVMIGNHRPGLRSVDEAMRRRLHLVEFPITFRGGNLDKELSTKLKAEWPGILAWAIKGALIWRATGLVPPARVREATSEYLAEQDVLGEWIQAACDQGSDLWASSAAMFENWRRWADRMGEDPLGVKRFSQALGARGFVSVRGKGGRRGFRGLRLHGEGELLLES